MSQGVSIQAGKTSTSRVAGSFNGASGSGSRLLQNYPQEPIGTRPSYVGELVAILRDGTPELRSLLEAECDLRFNCKVCGSILPSTRSFVIHKRQFCTTKYVEYQRRNVAIMERISNVVSYETKCLQTGDDMMLDPANPVNACLLVPLPVPQSVLQNGQSHSEDEPESASRTANGSVERPAQKRPEEQLPAGVEIIQPSRPPADGVYRFGMGGMGLIANKRKNKTRVHASGTVKKKRKQAHVIPDAFASSSSAAASSSPTAKKYVTTSANRAAANSPATPFKSIREGPIMTVTKPPPPKPSSTASPMTIAKPPMTVIQLTKKITVDDCSSNRGAESSPAASKRGDGFQRSRRLGPPINGFDMDAPRSSFSAAKSVSVEPVTLTNGSAKPPADGAADGADRSARDVREPAFVRRLLEQMCEVADYVGKKCRECNRSVVSIYNLDRHVATQHLGLKESEYSLISKELRRLRAELFAPGKADVSLNGGGESDKDDSPVKKNGGDGVDEMDSHDVRSCESAAEKTEQDEEGENEAEGGVGDVDEGNINGGVGGVDQPKAEVESEHEKAEDVTVDAVDVPPLPTTSKPPSVTSDSQNITKRLTSMIQNPDTLKEILTTKDKPDPPVDYELSQLVEIQRKISDAGDAAMQVCRICNKPFFDVYVMNRHIMTVHLRLPERSCGTINKMIKDNMKRHPEAFGASAPLLAEPAHD